MGNWILGKDEITLQKNAEKRHKKDNLKEALFFFSYQKIVYDEVVGKE